MRIVSTIYCLNRCSSLFKNKLKATSQVVLASNNYSDYTTRKYNNSRWYAAGLIGSSLLLYVLRNDSTNCKADEKKKWPVIRLADVKKHRTKKTRIWCTYKGSVYDITDFVDVHPGGKKILLAAGESIEPFWAIYGVHNTPEVREILEEYKIGILSQDDLKLVSKPKTGDPYANDPERHPALTPASVKPFNAEPPSSLLVDNFNTPNELFYVRNHLPVPEVDEKKFKLVIVDIDGHTKCLSLKDIKKFPKYTVNAAVQCAGNRRSEMTKIKPVKGLSWGHAAIGNADWSGARLVDVLKKHGFGNSPKIRHIQMEGLDAGPDGVTYGASVPANIALDPRHDVILAYEMNGKPLPKDHGAPLRAIVPGIVGARNVKWLGKIILSDKESDSHWQQKDYKGFSPSVDWHNVDFSKSPAIQELPVISAICCPENGEKIKLEDGHLSVKGYAWSGGGKRIVRVDISTDEGKTWHVAKQTQGNQDEPYHWGWTVWSIDIPFSEESNSKVNLWVKAVDSSYNTQPESFEHIWNLRGVLSNAYHKISITIAHS